MRILCVGPIWRGSNAGGLFRALNREGCLIEVIDEFYYISLRGSSKKMKIIERFIRPHQAVEYNLAIKKQLNVFKPDILFVYKGAFVFPETIEYAKSLKCKVCMFYPDVSLTNHGDNIPKCLPLYELVFTTKTFGIHDMKDKFGVKNMYFIPHGYDPEIHRKIDVGAKEKEIFGCDASFIGTWSAKKEKWLTHLKQQMPQLNLAIWGEQWHKSSSDLIKSSIKGTAILGDLYAVAIQCSKINLGILSEQVVGASSGDLITSRTFHIPGANGFMLHERNEESVLYFKEDEEAGFFDGPEELTEKVKLYLGNDTLREQIKAKGNARAQKDHSLDARAREILVQFNKL